jgi:hypothetical protein
MGALAGDVAQCWRTERYYQQLVSIMPGRGDLLVAGSRLSCDRHPALRICVALRQRVHFAPTSDFKLPERDICGRSICILCAGALKQSNKSIC